MDGYRAFEMRTGPYIPERHLGYGLLPELTASGGEVFSYPAELNEVDGMVIKCEGDKRDERGRRVSRIMPYGFGAMANTSGCWRILPTDTANPTPRLLRQSNR